MVIKKSAEAELLSLENDEPKGNHEPLPQRPDPGKHLRRVDRQIKRFIDSVLNNIGPMNECQ
jgi:hypothetical protein